MFALDTSAKGARLVLKPQGDWVIARATRLRSTVDAAADAAGQNAGRTLLIDLAELGALDTAGAFLLARLEKAWVAAGRAVEWAHLDGTRRVLIERVRQAAAGERGTAAPASGNPLARLGAVVVKVGDDLVDLLAMLGATVAAAAMTVLRPRSFRSTAIINQMDVAGVRALPIVLLMSMIVGGILAQQGAFQLRFFGAEIFTVDLVGILALREIAPMLTAIMLAGRSGSAITAELGSMQMREEIDAMRVMGLSPVNVLVVPRVTALVLVLPMLTFLAALAMLAGACATLWLYTGISPTVFVSRLRDAIDFSTFASGLIKTPFMALIIALVACAEGMAVRGSAESLGRNTTASVVKSIFLVIVVDGIFAVFYGAIEF